MQPVNSTKYFGIFNINIHIFSHCINFYYVYDCYYRIYSLTFWECVQTLYFIVYWQSCKYLFNDCRYHNEFGKAILGIVVILYIILLFNIIVNNIIFNNKIVINPSAEPTISGVIFRQFKTPILNFALSCLMLLDTFMQLSQRSYTKQMLHHTI